MGIKGHFNNHTAMQMKKRTLGILGSCVHSMIVELFSLHLKTNMFFSEHSDKVLPFGSHMLQLTTLVTSCRLLSPPLYYEGTDQRIRCDSNTILTNGKQNKLPEIR